MKQVICVLAGLLMATAAHAEWYKGGNLHRSTGELWHQASNDNRVATSADFITASSDRLRNSPPNRDELYFQSLELVACINEVFGEPSIRSLRVAEIAILCMAEMRWLR